MNRRVPRYLDILHPDWQAACAKAERYRAWVRLVEDYFWPVLCLLAFGVWYALVIS